MVINPAFKNDESTTNSIILAFPSSNNLIRVESSSRLENLNSKQELNKSVIEPKIEKWYFTLLQIVIPFFIAGFGMVAAGLLLDHVQKKWELYTKIEEVIVLVPALLGLKGNLEMTLASRMSTQVNLKLIYDKKTIKTAVLSNLALTQLQSIVVGFLASLVACVTQLALESKFPYSNLLILIASSICTASFASLLLGSIIMFIIILSHQFKINPDNISTPIASSLGDLVTLAILSCIGTILLMLRNYYWIHIILIVSFISMVPLLAIYCYKCEFVKETLFQGWAPIITAMLISSIAGVILEFAIIYYSHLTIYQPVVNGVGGNLVAIYASRLSTSLHKTSQQGSWADWAPKKFILYPFETFFGKKNPEYKTALILQVLTIPGHLVFFFTIFFLNEAEDTVLTVWLVVFYMFFAILQAGLLLIMCYFLIHIVWRLEKNPDNLCIPLLTASGDFFGVTFLFLCFHLVYLTGNTSLKTVLSTTTTTLSFNNSYTNFTLFNTSNI